MGVVLKNNAETTLSAAISSLDTTIPVSDTSSFPQLAVGEYFYCTIESTSGAYEIVKITQVDNTNLIAVRGQEDTIAIPFSAGARVELRVTVQNLEDFFTAKADAEIGTQITDAINALNAIITPDTPVQGNILYYNGSNWKVLAPGTSGYFLKTNGPAANPSWAAGGGAGLVDGDYGDITVGGSGTTMTIDNGAVSFAKIASMSTGHVIYRKTAGTGPLEEQNLATLKTDLGLTGTNSGDQTITLTGDVTGSGTGSFAATIANNAVTYAKMQDVSATNRFLGRITSGAGDTEELTGAQATTLLDTFTSGLKGLAPASGGGTTNFLRADGTWAAPPGGGGGLSDGDYGDITVGGTGTTMTIDAGVVTLAKMANLNQYELIGRSTAGAGIPQAIATSANVYTLLGSADYAAFRNSLTLGAAQVPTFAGVTLTGGTVTVSTPLIDATQTWNNAGVTFTALKLNVTDTASAAASLLQDWQVGGSSVAYITKGGNLTLVGSSNSITIGTNVQLARSGGAFSFRMGAGATEYVNFNSGSNTFTGGTQTVDAPILNMTQTWNNAGVTFTALKLNVTDTTSASASKLLDLQVGGSSALQVTKAGTTTFGTSSTIVVNVSSGIDLLNARDFSFSGTLAGAVRWGTDLYLYRDAAATLAQRNSTNAQTFNLYTTYTDASNYERLEITSSGGTSIIRTTKLGTGASRGIKITADNELLLGAGANDRFRVQSTCFRPESDLTYDLGTAALGWRDIFLSRSIKSINQTITADTPILDLQQTWNNAGVTFTGLKFNVATDTASNANSLLLALQVAASQKFFVTKAGSFGTGTSPTFAATGGGVTSAGVLRLNNGSANGSFDVVTWKWPSSAVIGWTSSTDGNGTSHDLMLTRSAAATLQYGAADAATAVAQTQRVQSVAAGNSNVAGADWTLINSLSTGTGAAGNLVIKSGFANPNTNSTVTMTIASPCVVTWTAHPLVPGSVIQFTTTGALPTGVTASTNYYVLSTGLTANTFQFSATHGGTAINSSGSQSGTHTATTQVNVQNRESTVMTIGPSGTTGSQSIPALNLTQVWNTSGTGVLYKGNATRLNSATNGFLIELQTDGTDQFYVNRFGNTYIAGAWFVNADSVIGGSSTAKLYFASGSVSPGSTGDVYIGRDSAANTLAQANGANAQSFRVYGTRTDASNYERAAINTVAGTSIELAAETAGTGGDNLDLKLTPAGTGRVKVTGAKEQLWIPAAAMKPRTSNGCAALATTETTTNKVNIETLDFDAAAAEYAQFTIRAPKSWGTSTFTAKFYWKHAATATNFGVVWGIQAGSFGDNEALDAAFGTAQTVIDTGGTTNNHYISPATAAVTVANFTAEENIYFQVYRDATNGSDNLAIDAGLIGVMLEWTPTQLTDD